jgi:hypothetical protein
VTGPKRAAMDKNKGRAKGGCTSWLYDIVNIYGSID